jgi:hypothetical protein
MYNFYCSLLKKGAITLQMIFKKLYSKYVEHVLTTINFKIQLSASFSNFPSSFLAKLFISFQLNMILGLAKKGTTQFLPKFES